MHFKATQVFSMLQCAEGQVRHIFLIFLFFLLFYAWVHVSHVQSIMLQGGLIPCNLHATSWVIPEHGLLIAMRHRRSPLYGLFAGGLELTPIHNAARSKVSMSMGAPPKRGKLPTETFTHHAIGRSTHKPLLHASQLVTTRPHAPYTRANFWSFQIRKPKKFPEWPAAIRHSLFPSFHGQMFWTGLDRKLTLRRSISTTMLVAHKCKNRCGRSFADLLRSLFLNER